MDGLRELGHHASIVSLGASEPKLPWVLDVDVSRRPLLRLINEMFLRVSFGILSQVGYLLAGWKTIKEFRPDVVLFHYSTSGLFLHLATRLWETKPLLVFDWNDLSSRMAFWPKSSGLRYRVSKWLEEAFTARKAQAYLVVTEFAKGLLTRWGFRDDRIFVLNELVSLEPYLASRQSSPTSHRPDGEYTLVWHGFIRPYQVPGLVGAIRAVDLLRGNGMRCHIKIIGSCENSRDQEKLQTLASSQGSHVKLMGPLDKGELRSHLVAADLGLQLLPDTLFGRFINGVKLSEYICAELPVVVTALEGPAELVRGNGFLVRPSDAEDLAEKISLALESGGRLADRSSAIAAEEFSRDGIRNKIRSLSAVFERMHREWMLSQ